jgi:hypothetical protein
MRLRFGLANVDSEDEFEISDEELLALQIDLED